MDPYEVRLGSMVDLDGDGVISQDEKEYLKDLIADGKLKNIDILRDVSFYADHTAAACTATTLRVGNLHRSSGNRDYTVATLTGFPHWRWRSGSCCYLNVYCGHMNVLVDGCTCAAVL